MHYSDWMACVVPKVHFRVSSTTLMASNTSQDCWLRNTIPFHLCNIFSTIVATFEDFERTLTPETPSLDITCPSSCEGLEPGSYQSCAGCNQYMMCLDNGMMLDGLYCGTHLEWDDNEKMCVLDSSTCPNPPQKTTGLPEKLTTTVRQEDSKMIGPFESALSFPKFFDDMIFYI